MSNSEPRRDKAVTARARNALRDFLGGLERQSLSLDDVERFVEATAEMGEELMPALMEILSVEDRVERGWAAGMIVAAAAVYPQINIGREFLERAQESLIDILREGTNEERLLPCILLANGGTPEAAIPILHTFLEGDDDRLRIGAAAALAGCGAAGALAVPILGKALRQENEALAAIAASGLAGLGVRQKDAIAELMLGLSNDDPGIRYHIILALKRLGPAAESAAEALSFLVADDSIAPALRGAAASALGNVTRATEADIPVLVDALCASDWQVVDGAMDGLLANGRIPGRALSRLVELLSHDDEILRGIAAAGLNRLGARAAVAAPALRARIGEERSLDVGDEIASALASIGSVSIPPLVEIVKAGDMNALPIAIAALTRMADVEAVFRLLLNASDERVRGTAIYIARDLGPRAAPAVPALAKMLDEAEDDETAAYIVLALAPCGAAAKPAAPALIRCLIHRNEETASWAGKALVGLGSDAVPILEEALKDAQGVAKRRLQTALDEFRLRSNRFAHLEELDCDDLLGVFTRIGEILEERGPTSFATMESLLADTVLGSDAKGEPITGRSRSSLRQCVKTLGEWRGCALTDHVPGRKGGLTIAGQELLREAREYLLEKERRRTRGGS